MVRAFLVMAFTVILCQSRAACQTPNKTEVDQRVVELAEKNAKTIARQSRSTVHLPRFEYRHKNWAWGLSERMARYCGVLRRTQTNGRSILNPANKDRVALDRAGRPMSGRSP